MKTPYAGAEGMLLLGEFTYWGTFDVHFCFCFIYGDEHHIHY